ncbi:MAG: hypothetical protein F6K55_39265 [Moorea sp. SIO4A3]|nr:hypothetical protein [Moorena sp. SIO4A3]
MATLHKLIQRCSAVLGRQRGLGEAARSWGGSAVLGVPPMSNCRGSPHSLLPWSPPLAIAVVSPTRYCIKKLGLFFSRYLLGVKY